LSEIFISDYKMEIKDSDEKNIDASDKEINKKNTCLLICIIIILIMVLPSMLAFLAIF
jgi:hypothetical protein